MRPSIWVLTDFGTKDPYVPILKAMILKELQDIPIFDISHEISPQNVFEAAFVLKRIFPYLPQNSHVLAVVDPGVGTKRKNLILKTEKGYLIGPDNGIFTFVRPYVLDLWEFETPQNIPFTFHARDVYLPALIKLLKGEKPETFAKSITRIETLEVEEPELLEREAIARIIYFDRFGNAITNLTEEKLKSTGKSVRSVKIKGLEIPFCKTYADVPEKEPLALFGSFGELEISVRNGSAKEKLSLEFGTKVQVILR